MSILPKRFAMLSIPSLLLALAASSFAIEIELDTGKKLQVKRVTYDSSGFTLYDSTKTKFPASRVKLMDADESRAELRAIYAEKSLEKLKRDSAEEIAGLKKALELERNNAMRLSQQITTLTQSLRKKKEEAAELKARADTADTFRKDAEMLRAARVSDHSTIATLKQTVTDLREAAKPKPPAPAPKPVVAEVHYTESKTEGLVKVLGRVRNPGSRTARAVVLDVSVLDKEGNLLATALTFVTNLEPKALRPFWTDVEVALDAIGKVEVAVADVLLEKPEKKE